MITYDPKLGNLNIDSNIVTGFADSQKITFAPNEDRNLPHVNIDGEVDRAVNANISGILTIHLKTTSPWVKRFHQMARVNDTFPVSWDDFNEGAVTFSGSNCWIQSIPDITVAKEIESVDVEIFVPKPVIQ